MANAKPTDNAKTENKKYKLLMNVKYGNMPYNAGEKIEIADEDIEEFKATGAIFVEEDEKSEEEKGNSENE